MDDSTLTANEKKGKKMDKVITYGIKQKKRIRDKLSELLKFGQALNVASFQSRIKTDRKVKRLYLVSYHNTILTPDDSINERNDIQLFQNEKDAAVFIGNEFSHMLPDFLNNKSTSKNQITDIIDQLPKAQTLDALQLLFINKLPDLAFPIYDYPFRTDALDNDTFIQFRACDPEPWGVTNTRTYNANNALWLVRIMD